MLEVSQALQSRPTVVSINSDPQFPNKAVDPAIKEIGKYWAAMAEWRRADRRLKQLVKRLPEETRRWPRVQISTLLRGRDANTGMDIKEPIYAHSEFEIRREIKKNCDYYLRTFASPRWVQDPKSKTGWRRGSLTEECKQLRRGARKRYRDRQASLLAEFNSDKSALYKIQDAVGWRQALAAEDRARTLVCLRRYDAMKAKPLTLDGALALIEWINSVNRSEINSPGTGAPYGYRLRPPYGLGESYTAHVARNVAEFLRIHAKSRLSPVR